jgi:3-polyprenyl-4-hydroxybenzoate decarboxylase
LKPTEERVSRLTSAATIADVLGHAASEIASGSKLGSDATKKTPGEGFKHPWPPLIKMDESVMRWRDEISASSSGRESAQTLPRDVTIHPIRNRVSRLTSAATMNTDVPDHATSETASGSKLGFDRPRNCRAKASNAPGLRLSRWMPR